MLKVPYKGTTLEFCIHAASGQYRKAYKKNRVYLGKDPDKVLEIWLQKTDEIDRAESEPQPESPQPSPQTTVYTVSDVCNTFLAQKENRVRRVTWQNYKRYCDLLVEVFNRDPLVNSLGPDDFERLYQAISKTGDNKPASPASIKTAIGHIRTIFSHAFKNEWISQPRYGTSFNPPAQKKIKAHRRKKPPKQATRDEILALEKTASDTWKAMILFGLNTGSGNADTARLEWSDIGDDGWIEKPRHKNENYRRFKLWPETLEAIHKLPKTKSGLVFLSATGKTLIRSEKSCPITKGFAKLATKAGVNRENLSYYSMRHTFQQQAENSLDFPAIMTVMGHSDSSMSQNYRGKLPDDRIENVIQQVRKWFFNLQ